jgi:hypothetical protein
MTSFAFLNVPVGQTYTYNVTTSRYSQNLIEAALRTFVHRHDRQGDIPFRTSERNSACSPATADIGVFGHHRF